jgi:predicted RND superfamily exporter protein
MLRWILRRPIIVIFIIAIITLFFAWQIRNLSFKTSIYDLQIENLPETTRYEDFKKLFGSDEIIRVVVKAENIFDLLTFRKIEQLAESAVQIDGVRRVISLPGIKKAVDVSGNWGIEKFYAVVSGVDLFKNNLFSTDGKTTAFTLILKNEALPEDVIHGVRRLIADSSGDLSLYQIGMPLVSEALVKLTEKDFSRLPPITLLLIAIILFCLFRKLRYILIPLTCVGLALIWTFGLMALLHIPLSMLTMIVPVFLIAVGTAYCLHIVSEYIASLERGHDSRICLFCMLRHVEYIDYCSDFSSGGPVSLAGSFRNTKAKNGCISSDSAIYRPHRRSQPESPEDHLAGYRRTCTDLPNRHVAYPGRDQSGRIL